MKLKRFTFILVLCVIVFAIIWSILDLFHAIAVEGLWMPHAIQALVCSMTFVLLKLYSETTEENEHLYDENEMLHKQHEDAGIIIEDGSAVRYGVIYPIDKLNSIDQLDPNDLYQTGVFGPDEDGEYVVRYRIS